MTNTSGSTVRIFIVIGEAKADGITARVIADRVICQEVDWIECNNIDDHRDWRGVTAGSEFLRWASIREEAKRLGIRAHGAFNSQPDEMATRRALLLILKLDIGADAIVLIRDMDNQPNRRLGMEVARDRFGSSPVVVIAAVLTKRECWHITGFEPRDSEEEARLSMECQELGFDPRIHSQQLTASGDQDKKSAKRVLTSLLKNDRDREHECISIAELGLLANRGNKNGLASYMSELKEKLVPVFK